MIRMPMQNFTRKAFVFASFLVAGSSLTSVSALAHTRKVDHHLHVAAAHRHSGQRMASVSDREHLAARGHRARGAELSSAHGRHESGMERVTYTVHRHGRSYLHTVWRPRDSRYEASTSRLYSDGVYHGGWMECVPYARQVSGVDLTGDAYLWWGE